MRKHILLTATILCGLVLAACNMPELQSAPVEPPPPVDVQAPVAVPVPQAKAPSDIELVSAALIERLRGGRIAVANVTLDPEGQHAVGELSFDYAGFDVQDVAVTGYTVNVIEPGSALVVLEGAILFKDIINRRTGVYFATQYIMDKDGVNITKSVMTGIPPDFPRVETFFIPQAKLKEAASSLVTYTDYYLFAIENAEPMTYGEGSSKSGLKRDYYIMSFCKDRLFQDSSLSMAVTSRPNGAGTKLAEAISINDTGWRILIAGGKFAPGSSRNKFHVGVAYQQNPGGYLPEVVVGAYSNVKQTEASLAAAAQREVVEQTMEQTTAWPDASGEGPLSRGDVYLNPIFPEDVEVIQVRLKDLGLYTGKIDRNYGPLTKKALNSFNKQHGFPKDQWNIGVQKELFKGTGQ